MVSPPRWSADKIRIRITVYDGGFSGYLVCSQRLEGQTCNPCLSLLVACKVLPGRNGTETNRMIIANVKLQTEDLHFFEGKLKGFTDHESRTRCTS
jgi:hypothetical protein